LGVGGGLRPKITLIIYRLLALKNQV
jgi:hypothetical protein